MFRHKIFSPGGARAALVGLGILLSASSAHATQGFLGTWQGLYPDSLSDNNAGCVLCHITPSGSGFNPYGAEVWIEGISGAESFDSDEDPTGSSNITEINANTQPGWKEGDNPDGVTGDLDPVAGGEPPVADANGPYSALVDESITFDGTGSTDPDGDATIASYAWNFGDGNTGTGATPTHSYTAAGTYNVSLVVTDDTGLTGSDSSTATISDPLLDPVADANGPYSGLVGESITFDGTGSSDPDGTIVSYAWNFGDGNTGSGATPSHSYAAAGNYTVSLVVTDNDGLTGSDSSTATISDPPQPPVADANGPYSALVGESITFDGTGSSDPDGTIVSYAWNFGDGNTGTGATPTHSYAAVGVYTVSLVVTDNDGNTDSDTSTATISDIPQELPVADANGPYSALVGESITFDGTGSSDPDGTIVSYAWNFGDGNTGSGATPSHSYAAAGTYNVSLVVTDNDGNTDSDTSSATISDPPQPPIADANGPYSALVGESITFDGTGSSDPDGTIVSYAWDFGDGNTGTGATPSHAYAAAAVYNVSLVVTDNDGNTDSATSTATISDLPQTPVADANGPYSGLVGDLITFDGTGSTDPDNDIATYDWDFGDGNTGTGATPNHAYGAPGTYLVTLLVTDDTGLSDIATSSAFITEDIPQELPPVADANGPYTGTVGTPVAFDGSGSSDPNGDDTIVSYVWDFGDGNSGTGVAPSHTYETAGAYNVELTVTDETGLWDTDSSTADIADIGPLPPTADANGPYIGTAGIPVTFDASASTDPDNDIATYEWNFGDGTIVIVNSATVDHIYAVDGVYDIHLTVTDETGLSDSDATTATIYPEGGDADVFLNRINAPKQMNLRVDSEKERKIKVFGDGDTLEQDATVTLTASTDDDGVEVEIEPSAVTRTVVPGGKETRFDFEAEIECEEKGSYVIVWTATIDAAENADPSNDVVQAETALLCTKKKK